MLKTPFGAAGDQEEALGDQVRIGDQHMKTEQKVNPWLVLAWAILIPIIFLTFCTGGSDEESAAKKASERAANAEEIRKGFHCLSKWDGSMRKLTAEIKIRLNDPDSFEHIDTLITPVSASGTHRVKTRYSAKNAFGGRVQGEATATVRNSDCVLSNVEVTG